MRFPSLSFQVSAGRKQVWQRKEFAPDRSCLFFPMISKPLAPASGGLILLPPASPGGPLCHLAEPLFFLFQVGQFEQAAELSSEILALPATLLPGLEEVCFFLSPKLFKGTQTLPPCLTLYL